MQEQDLRKRAEKRVKAKMTFYTCIVVFGCTTAILLLLSSYMPHISHWLLLPLPAFVMVLGVLYIAAFGYAFKQTEAEDWQEAAIETEMRKLARHNHFSEHTDIDREETDRLDLQEPERLAHNLNHDDDFV